MGISGLLPALKYIQVKKHLSEFQGQTLAVDAYVWLHKGIFTCATELAMGKTTQKYIHYAMHRVRLLRHHNIEPYIVFDGGPLQAKKGTEGDRKQKREENLARGNALAAQGKHTQARECYVKCVDVTPQMAYQFIKALRAESVAYVVAPYEADAQLAYLEKIGLVDGIITEDSDLLVFGCRTVLFKLDVVASTVISISRHDFASVTGSESNSISLVGWSDDQFRSMAILSGCDYLPSIPGIGLKTACTLLRKWKTVEQVVRAVAMEGKKPVPPRYLNHFRLAEQCFLHQRVYCPLEEKLVYLTEIDADWTDEAEAHVGSYIEASTAKQVALGDADPITLLPMKDINPDFKPRAIKPLPFVSNGGIGNKYKGKERETSRDEGILGFFGSKSKVPSRPSDQTLTPATSTRLNVSVRRGSGKRTLADVMDQDLVSKKRMRESTTPILTLSKFFSPLMASKPPSTNLDFASQSTRRHSLPIVNLKGRSSLREEKENIYVVIDDDDDDDDDIDLQAKAQIDSDCDISIEGHCEANPPMEVEVEEPPDIDFVEQEDGYISPTPSNTNDAPDLSSPLRRGHSPQTGRSTRVGSVDDSHFGADPVSSPFSTVKKRTSRSYTQMISYRRSRSQSPTPSRINNTHSHNSLVHDLLPQCSLSVPILGPDLQDSFGDDLTSDIDCFEVEDEQRDRESASPPSPSPATPSDLEPVEVTTDDIQLSDVEESEMRAKMMRVKAVADGWKLKWALDVQDSLGRNRSSALKRRETNVTPTGKHCIDHAHSRLRPHPNGGPPTSGKPHHTNLPKISGTPFSARKSLLFFEAVKSEKSPKLDSKLPDDLPVVGSGES